MTEDDTRQPMGEISHTNPYTGKPFGNACAFERAPHVAADGGRRDAVDEDEQTMADVSHTPPHDDESDVNRVFERGTEGRDETV
ncbi:hypothetical protein VB773_14815 [Haloarculaceae archaeon H-GB2-1]|nr:hypothetical protein [Haloarculaceae archaeon H-GB1-1]MEA5387213.1 hypothetical protein [Haloarculaceae archaeon H-GB11]MEA5408708.1 hypothetical protein [Haloarculaceae archaeon H-GB2-1]